MKIIDLEQGSQEWLTWRKTVITATDASIIMGNNPWCTPYKCWQRKLGLIEEQPSNEAMERGKRLEPEARALFEEGFGQKMEPMVVESSDYKFLGASLDGISECKKFIVEIKCGGAKLNDMAYRGVIPEYYQDQMQHQLLVTGAEKAFYYCYDGKAAICIEVYPDPDFAKIFLPKAREFFRCIAFAESPPLSEKDYFNKSGDEFWISFAEEYREICEKIKKLEEMKEICRNQLIRLCGDQNCIGDGVRVMKTTMRGRVAYDDIPEIKGVDLDKYRKESTTSWKIMMA